jgi:hypothetical protein
MCTIKQSPCRYYYFDRLIERCESIGMVKPPNMVEIYQYKCFVRLGSNWRSQSSYRKYNEAMLEMQG